MAEEAARRARSTVLEVSGRSEGGSRARVRDGAAGEGEVVVPEAGGAPAASDGKGEWMSKGDRSVSVKYPPSM